MQPERAADRGGGRGQLNEASQLGLAGAAHDLCFGKGCAKLLQFHSRAFQWLKPPEKILAPIGSLSENTQPPEVSVVPGH